MAAPALESIQPATPSQDYKFISELPSGIKCMICSRAARNPQQCQECGKLFCKSCLENYSSDRCPSCNKKVSCYFNDKKSQEELLQLAVRCDNVDVGCGWKGIVKTLQEHVNECDFTLFLCPNKCAQDGKLTMIMKKDLESHLSDACPYSGYSCPHCHKKGNFDKQKHEEVCPMKVVDCPNRGCFQKLKREQLSIHEVSECKFVEVACKYKKLGCKVRKIRMFMQQHEDDFKVHLDMAATKITKLEDMVSNLTEETAKVLDNRKSFTFRLENFYATRRNNEKFSSQQFYTRPGGYKMMVRVHCNGYAEATGSHISIYAKLLKGYNDNCLSWPFVGSVTFEILNQLEDDHHFKKVLDYEESDNAQVNSGWGHTKFLPHSKLDETVTTQYLANDALFFRVTVREHAVKAWLECPSSKYCSY